VESLDKQLDASLAQLLNGSAFPEVCRSYYNLFDVPIRVLDVSGDLLAEVVHPHAPCRYVNKSEAGRNKCTQIRLQVKKAALTEDGIVYSDCFCGLRYAMAPIQFQKELVGKIVLGPYLPTGVEEPSAEASAVDPEIDLDELKTQLKDMRPVPEKAIRRIATAMLTVIDVILFSAHKAHVTSHMHLASIRESYRELTKKNRELQAMHDEMKEFERVKSNFLATISHELRTPLTSIIGYSDMLAEGIAGELREEQQQFVQTIKKKGDELLKLIHSILDFSRIETGHLDVHWVKMNPKEVIEEAVGSKKDSAERRGTRLTVEIPGDLPEVSIDPDKIRVAVEHLVENGIKFSPPGGVVKVVAQIVTPDDEDAPEEGFGMVLMAAPEMLEISVEDFGIGIPEGSQNEIFAPFTQLDASSTREQGGAGLGLAIVKQYAEAHGGKVLVKSKVGEGSKFTIRIPVVDRS
jgi:two-component system sensor histidine kinase BarA